MRIFNTRFALLAGFGCLLSASTLARAQQPLSTAFTYQGELASAGTPASGTYDVRFRLFDAASGGNQIGGTLCSDNLAVLAGRFGVSLDFGGVFAGQQRFLEIEVRQDSGLGCDDATGYTVLSPRQELTAAPNATFAQSAGSAANATNATSLNGQSPSFYQNASNLTGTLADSQLSSNVARLNSNQTFTGLLNFTNPGNTFAGSGAGLTNLSGGSISAGTLARSSLSGDVQGGVGTVAFDLSLAGSVTTAGAPGSVAVSGSFAYVVSSSNTLQVFNLSTPTAPTLAGSVATGTNPQSVAVSGSLACVVNYTSNTLQVFDMSNPAAPALAGSVATGSGPISVAVSGSFAYVVNGSNTLQVFNISNPAAPTLAGSIANQLSVPRCIAVSGSFAYVVDLDSDRLKVFNISNPAAPTLAGSIATGWFPFSVAVSGSFAYVVCRDSDTLQVFDISNPAAITLAGSVATDDVPYYISVSGSYVHVVNAASNTLQVFNINNPATPTLAGRVAAPAHPIFVVASGSLAYVLNADTLMVFNTLGVRFGTPLSAASLVGVDGSRLTGVNAVQLNGQAASFYTNASNITAGTLASAQIPNLDASKVTTGTLADARLSSMIARLNSNQTFTGLLNFTNAGNTFVGSGAGLNNINGGNITTGTLANARTTATTANTPNTIVQRDASGNFTATNADNATNVASGAFSEGSLIGNGTFTGASYHDPVNRGVKARVGYAITPTGLSEFAGMQSIVGPGTAGCGNSGDVAFFTWECNTGSSREIMRINGRGNVGIGTTSPSARLHVTGANGSAFQVNDFASGASTQLVASFLGNAAGPQVRFQRAAGGAFVDIGQNAANDFVVKTNDTARLIVSSTTGNVQVVNSLSKAGGSFKIDHPLDPENKYLYHSFVESPDMMNIYNGEVTTDGTGYAIITLPDYFEALNRDFRYQLTVIDDNDQSDTVVWAKVVRRIGVDETNTFAIRTFRPNVAVSWQVTGIRRDAWAQKNRIPNAVEKTGPEKGKLLHPEAFGKPAEQGIYSAAPAATPSVQTK